LTENISIKNEEIKMNIYVGNLSYDVTEDDLQNAFAAFGDVVSVKIIKDQYNGKSKGFGFVEMPDRGEANAAIEGLNTKEIKGRSIKVNMAKPRSGRGGVRGRHGGGRFYRGGNRRNY
jgi:RNA recognition motif-containing protein